MVTLVVSRPGLFLMVCFPPERRRKTAVLRTALLALFSSYPHAVRAFGIYLRFCCSALFCLLGPDTARPSASETAENGSFGLFFAILQNNG